MTYIIYLWAMEELFTALLPRNFDKRIISHPLELKPLSEFSFFQFPYQNMTLKSLVGWLVGQSVGVSLRHLSRFNVK